MEYSPFFNCHSFSEGNVSIGFVGERPRAACSFSGGARGAKGVFWCRLQLFFSMRYTYKFKIMQNLKSTENQKNQLKKCFQLI